MSFNRRQALGIFAGAVVAGVGESFTPASAAPARALKNGVDISWLPDVEKAGAVFTDTKGMKRDPIRLLKEAGVRVGRIRLWVNAADGAHSTADAIKLARRLKSQGLEVCVDLHFSDTWADPAHQTLPAKWQDKSFEDLVVAVEDYTYQTLSAFVAAGVRPQWVQLGNEITNGFLWPHGRINSDSPSQWQAFVALHNAASKSLKRVLPTAKSVVHLDCGGDVSRVRWWLQQAVKYQLTGINVIGLSYYSQWHGSLLQLSRTLDVVAREFRFPVVIAETAYPWTERRFGSDVIDISKARLSGFSLSKAGQAAYVRKLSWMLSRLPAGRGLGLWWWEGLTMQVKSANGTLQRPSVVTNSALVDLYGRENPALREL